MDLCLILIILLNGVTPAQRLFSPLITPMMPLHPITVNKSNKEVFGFAPYWNMDKLNNIDFKVLTTLAYFDASINPDGTLDRTNPGYQTFTSPEATNLFRKAHANGTRVVLTVSQMDNGNIEALMDDPDAQASAINETVSLVKQRGIDGINIDIEYQGDPGQSYRDKFSQFVAKLTNKMHQTVPGSQVTVSVYASAVKDPKIYDIAALSRVTDGIFMMAYDFAVAGSDNAIPTSPLYGHQDGTYWYDIASAVNDFTQLMPPNKLILGVPYYGYNYSVDQPGVKAPTGWGGTSQTYTTVADNIKEGQDGITQVVKGWDDYGKVGYVAYVRNGNWRMVFMEDQKSLGLKYDFAKAKGLMGVGMWALGNDDGHGELWVLLEDKFGAKSLAAVSTERPVSDINE